MQFKIEVHRFNKTMIKSFHLIFTLWCVCGIALGTGNSSKKGAEQGQGQSDQQPSINSSRGQLPIFNQTPMTTPREFAMTESKVAETKTSRKKIFDTENFASKINLRPEQLQSSHLNQNTGKPNSIEMSQMEGQTRSPAKLSRSGSGIKLTQKEKPQPKIGINIASESVKRLQNMIQAQKDAEAQTSFELVKPKKATITTNSDSTPSKKAKISLVSSETNKVKREFESVTNSPLIDNIQLLMISIGSSKILSSDYLPEEVKESYTSLTNNFRLLMQTLSTDSMIPASLHLFLVAFKNWLQSFSLQSVTDVYGAVEHTVRYTEPSFDALNIQLDKLLAEVRKHCQGVSRGSLRSESCDGALQSTEQMTNALGLINTLSVIKTTIDQTVYRVYRIADKNFANLKLKGLKKQAFARLDLFFSDSHNFKRHFSNSELFTPMTLTLSALRQIVDSTFSADLVSHAIEFVEQLESKLVTFHVYSVRGKGISKYLKIDGNHLFDFDGLIKFFFSKFATFTNDDTSRILSNLDLVSKAIAHAFTCKFNGFMLELIAGADVCMEINGALIQNQDGTKAAKKADKTVNYVNQVIGKISHLRKSGLTPIFAYTYQLLNDIAQVLKVNPDQIENFGSVIDLVKSVIPLLNSVTSHTYNVNGYNIQHSTYEVPAVNSFRDLLKEFASQFQQFSGTNPSAASTSAATDLKDKIESVSKWIDDLINENGKYYEINDRSKVHYVLPQYKLDKTKNSFVKSKPLRNKVYIHNNKTTLKYLINQLESQKKLKLTNFYKVIVPALNVFLNFYNNGPYSAEDVKKFDDISKKFGDVINGIRSVQTTFVGGRAPRKITKNQFDPKLVSELIASIEDLKNHGKENWSKPGSENPEMPKLIDSLASVEGFLNGLKLEESFLIEYPELNGPSLPRAPKTKSLNSSVNKSLNKSSVEDSLSYSVDSSNDLKLSKQAIVHEDDEELEDDFLTVYEPSNDSIQKIVHEIQNESLDSEKTRKPRDSLSHSNSKSVTIKSPQKKINHFEIIDQEFERNEQTTTPQVSNTSLNISESPYEEYSADKITPKVNSLIGGLPKITEKNPDSNLNAYSPLSSVNSFDRYLSPAKNVEDSRDDFLNNKSKEAPMPRFISEEDDSLEGPLIDPTESFIIESDFVESHKRKSSNIQNSSHSRRGTPSNKLLEGSFLNKADSNPSKPTDKHEDSLENPQNLANSDDNLSLDYSHASSPERFVHKESPVRSESSKSFIFDLESDLNDLRQNPSDQIDSFKKSKLNDSIQSRDRKSVKDESDSLDYSISQHDLSNFAPSFSESSELLNARKNNVPRNKGIDSDSDDSLEIQDHDQFVAYSSPLSVHGSSASEKSRQSVPIHPGAHSDSYDNLHISTSSISDASHENNLPETSPEMLNNRDRNLRPKNLLEEEDDEVANRPSVKTEKSIPSLHHSDVHKEGDSYLLDGLDEAPDFDEHSLQEDLLKSRFSEIEPERRTEFEVASPQKKRKRRVVIVFIEQLNCLKCLDDGSLAYFVRHVLRVYK